MALCYYEKFDSIIKGITSNHKGDVYLFIFFHSYITKEELKTREKVCNDHDYCFVEMSNDETKY